MVIKPKLFNFLGDVVQEGGPYSDPNSIKTIILGFTSSSCYRLEVYDSGNDGLTGNGFYQVVYGTNSTAFVGGDFSDKDVNEITYDIVGVDENDAAVNSLNIFPNPATDKISVSLMLSDSKNISVEIYDLTGKKVTAQNLGTQPAGWVNTSFDVSLLQSGVYIIKTLVGNRINVNKVIVR